MQADLRAIALWYEWSGAIARNKADVTKVLPAIATPRITSKKAPSRVVSTLTHARGDLELEMRVTFASTPVAEVELFGTHRESAAITTESTAEHGSVSFLRKRIEISWVHEGVTKVLGTVLARTSFLPADLALLCEVADITRLGIAIDSKYGFGYVIRYDTRYGADFERVYAKLGLSLTRGDGTPFTPLDVEMHEALKGPNDPGPADVRWRDARGHESTGQVLWFGGKGARVMLGA